MSYYWLNQRTQDDSNYQDEVGEVYHYRSTTGGAQQLDVGDKFVYYRPGAYELFGTGEIERIEEKNPHPEGTSEAPTQYYAYIRNYRPFDPPVVLKGVGESDLKNRLSFLKNRPGLTGVPQHSIHELSKSDFKKILETAGLNPDI